MKVLRGGLRAIVLAGLFLAASSCAEIQGQLNDVLSQGGGNGLDEQTVVEGLKQALEVGTKRTVLQTSKVDGFLGNALIRIALPKKYEKMADTMRKLGFGKQVDELEVAMNRAAEKAAGEARPVFVNAIKQMTLPDAFKILRGDDTAATEYFRAHTTDTLREKFRPIVKTSMEKVGLYNAYNKVADRYNQLPFVTKPAVNLDNYVTNRTLSGLFTVLGQQEKRIRENPAARTTELLKKVFGKSN
ncbi:MAG: DUF4197 domain-containing protein [Acidobacteriota bacterium]|jgi:RNA binding exosome subunit